MKTMWVSLVFFIFASVVAKNPLHPSEMCIIEENYTNREQSPEVEDCSFQFPPGKEGFCNVFTKNACDNKTSKFKKDIVDSETESKAKFSVAVLPYTAVINLPYRENGKLKFQKSPPLSAFNITFQVLHKDVTGLAFFINDDSVDMSFCRFMDFEAYPDKIFPPVDLFYDCFYCMTERNIQNVTMTFISLPMKESLSYYVFIPEVIDNSLCNWQSLIMVFKKSLANGLVQIKFSTAPQIFNVSSYVVELINVHTEKKVYKIIQSEKEMASVEFSSIEGGFYFVSVKPFNFKDSTCTFASTQLFYVAASFNLGRVLMLLLGSSFLLVLCFVSVWKCYHMYKNSEHPYKQALFVYSEDCKAHKDFISSFASYLTFVHNINVSTIYGEIMIPKKWTTADPDCADLFSKDPQEWIRNRYKDSEIIIFIISKGMYTTLQENVFFSVEEISHWCRQLPNAKNYISHQIFNSPDALKKRFCIVCFPYASKNQIPSCLSDIGKCYQLPKDMKAFLGFLFDYKPLIPFTNLYCRLSSEDATSLILKKEFWNKMKIVQKAFENQTEFGVVKHEKHAKFEQRSPESVSSEDNSRPVESEDHVSGEEKDSEPCEDARDIYVKRWESYLARVYNDSRSADCINQFTPLIKQEFEEEIV